MEEKVKTIEEGVKKLFYAVDRPMPEFLLKRKEEGQFTDVLCFNGAEIPLFESRYDPYIDYIASYGKDVEKNSTLNVYSFTDTNETLDELMFRELEIAEYILHSKIHSVTACMKKNAVTMIVVMENDTAANMDLGNTMAPGSTKQCQHRLVTSKGMACDRATGDYIVESPINVYTSGSPLPKTYDDDQCLLYGLNSIEINKAAAVYAILTGKIDAGNWMECSDRIIKAIKAAYESDRTGKTVLLGDREED